MQSASIYKEVYQAETGESLDAVPEEISPVTFFLQVTIYRGGQSPQWVDIDGKRYRLEVVAENELIDLD